MANQQQEPIDGWAGRSTCSCPDGEFIPRPSASSACNAATISRRTSQGSRMGSCTSCSRHIRTSGHASSQRRFIDETSFFSREAVKWNTKDVHILILDMITFGRPNIPKPALHQDPRTVLASILYEREFAATVSILTQRSRSSPPSDERYQGTPNTTANSSRAAQNQTTSASATAHRQDSNQDVRVPPASIPLASGNSHTRQGTYFSSPDGGWTTG